MALNLILYLISNQPLSQVTRVIGSHMFLHIRFNNTNQNFIFKSFVHVNFVGVLFSEEVTASLDKYSRELADSVMEKARKICKDYNVRK